MYTLYFCGKVNGVRTEFQFNRYKRGGLQEVRTMQITLFSPPEKQRPSPTMELSSSEG